MSCTGARNAARGAPRRPDAEGVDRVPDTDMSESGKVTVPGGYQDISPGPLDGTGETPAFTHPAKESAVSSDDAFVVCPRGGRARIFTKLSKLSL